MKKATAKAISFVLSALLFISSFGVYASAENEAELAAEFQQKILTVKDNTLAPEEKDYSQKSEMYDNENEYRYRRYISANTNLRIGNWSIGKVWLDSTRQINVFALVRTNSSSTLVYSPYNGFESEGGTQITNFSASSSSQPLAGNEQWEIAKITVTVSADNIAYFQHGQLKFGTAAGKYFDIAAWGLFNPSITDETAAQTLKSASKVSAENVVTVRIADENGNVANDYFVGTITPPVLEDNTNGKFMGYTNVKGGYDIVALGGQEYTPTESTVLYPVFAKSVRFVNGSAEQSGNGLTAQTPFKTFKDAASSLATDGGTIVVVGATTYNGNDLANTGNITVTSVYDGVDYRTSNSAKLTVSHFQAQYVENPGKITFENLDVVTSAYANWHLNSHPFEIKNTCNIIDLNGSAINNVQIMGLISGTPSYTEIKSPLNITVDKRITCVILGSRADVTIGGAEIFIEKDGNVSTVSISNNNNEGDSTLNHGKLSVNGDVKITVNGKLESIGARKSAYHSQDGATVYGLDKFNGNLSVIVNAGASFSKGIQDSAKPSNGKWFILRATEGAKIEHGSNGGFVLSLDDTSSTFNTAVLKNATTNKEYKFLITQGVSNFSLEESGDYTVTYAQNESKTVTYIDNKFQTQLESESIVSGQQATLKSIPHTPYYTFEGWTDESNGTVAKYLGGNKITVDEDITLYAVWSEKEVYTVTFMNGGDEFHKFVGAQGATIEYPNPKNYPSKEGYLFAGWDSDISIIGNSGVVINAKFVTAEEVGAVYYWNGDAQTDGNGTYEKPFKNMASVVKAINQTGGTVVLTEKCLTIYTPLLQNSKDVIFTSVDPLTNVDFRGTFTNSEYNGGCLFMPQTGTFWGGTEEPGAIIFQNIDILNQKGQYGIGHLSFDGHPFEIGENVRHYSPETGKEIDWFIGGTTPNNKAQTHKLKAVFKSPVSGANYLVRGGATDIDSVEYEFYAKTTLNVALDGSATVNINGPIRFTYFEGSQGSELKKTNNTVVCGAKAYASIIQNNQVSITNNISDTFFNNNIYKIVSKNGGTVVHTQEKGKYKVSSEEYNYAQLLDSDNNVVSETVITDNSFLTAPSYGQYTVVYSNKTLYGAKYVSSPYDEICPEEYKVTLEDTEKHTITLPTLPKQTAHSFEGWTTEKDSSQVTHKGGATYKLTGMVTFYAVWKAIPTVSVTFKDDGGNTLHTSTGYVGSPLTFPQQNAYKYGKELLGYAYENTTEILNQDSLHPESDKTAIPVWGEIPRGKVRLYVNGDTGSDENDGISPQTPLATITKAVSLIKDDGGYIIVTGGSNPIGQKWNNAGDITLTSYDITSGIDYKAKTLSQDNKSFTQGATVTYNWVPFGYDVKSGKITINNIALVCTQASGFLCFEGHPFELGENISAYRQESTIYKTTMFARALGEADSKTVNAEGIAFTLNTIDGSATVYAIGKADNTVPMIDITVNSEFNGNLNLGNDSGGVGKSTISNGVKFTLNASIKNVVTLNTSYTNSLKCNMYVVRNNGATANFASIPFEEGYGVYQAVAGSNVTLEHGTNNGEIVATVPASENGKYIEVTDSDGNIIEVLTIENGKASFTLKEKGICTVKITDIAMRKITFETGDKDIAITSKWFPVGETAEIPQSVYRYGYIFKGWSDGNNVYTEGAFEVPNQDVTLTAIWENDVKRKITFDANGSNIELPEEIEEYPKENIVLKKVASSDSTFIGWNTDSQATTGFLNYTVSDSDVTLYAITTNQPAYIVDSHFRNYGDITNNVDGKYYFRRYVVDVYLENINASSGAFKLNTNNGCVYYLGYVPVDGIDADVSANQVTTTVSGVPGLSYFTTPWVEVKWNSEDVIETTASRRKVVRLMFAMSTWGTGYEKIQEKTTDEMVSAFSGYTAYADKEQAYVSANIYSGVKGEEVKLSGKVTLEGRESGTTAKYDYAKMYIFNENGDAVYYTVLENGDTSGRTFDFSTTVLSGNYTVKVVKSGYVTREVPITVGEESLVIPEIVLIAGDIKDSYNDTYGDGIVDIDDFMKVIKGFNPQISNEYLQAADLNEDGVINTSDLSIVKKAFMKNRGEIQIESNVVKDNSLKKCDWNFSFEKGKITVEGGSEEAVASANSIINDGYIKNGVYIGPVKMNHTVDYELDDIFNNGISIKNYKIVVSQNNKIAVDYASYIKEQISETTGYNLEVVYDDQKESDYEIIVGSTSRAENTVSEDQKYLTFEKDGKFYVFFGDEQSAEMASIALCTNILGVQSEGFNGAKTVNVVKDAKNEGEWTVLSRFGVMSDSHIGKRYNWANYDWLTNTFNHFEQIHNEAHLDFIISLGDNIDDGYANSYATDYATYLELIKGLEICDPENPIDDREDGKIPHYELCGNHDPIGGQTDSDGNLKVRFFKNRLWYTENENGEIVAHIGFFTGYGGYPLYNFTYSNSYASYKSYGIVDDEMVKFVENSIIEANQKGAKHIILYNHWGISQDVGAPMLPESGLAKIASVCEKYGVKLYFNGHEHNTQYTLRRYNDIYDYDVSMTSQKHAVVEITSLRAKITIYNTSDNSVYREDVIPLSGKGEAVQSFAK